MGVFGSVKEVILIGGDGFLVGRVVLGGGVGVRIRGEDEEIGDGKV